MYIPFSELRGFGLVGREVGAADEAVELGALDDLYVDARDWRVAYLVVSVGGPLAARRVLLEPDRPVEFDLAGRRLLTGWTPYDVDTAADAGSLRTAGEQAARDAGDAGGDDPDRLMFGPGDPSAPGGGGAVLGGDPDAELIPLSEEERHLRGARELVGYTVRGTDADVGPVADLLIHRERPALSWLAVDTGTWLSRREVVLDPKWIGDVSWGERRMDIGLTRAQVRDAPALEGLDGLDHAYGAALAAFYRFVS